jgi:hypothetical protein
MTSLSHRMGEGQGEGFHASSKGFNKPTFLPAGSGDFPAARNRVLTSSSGAGATAALLTWRGPFLASGCALLLLLWRRR